MKKIVFATNNAHKLQELRQILGNQYEILGLADIGCHEDIPETADTIEGNARMKAEYVKQHYGYDCFSDDTGLEIDALNGEPGVLSARYAGPGHDSEANIEKVLKKLDGVTERTARFRTAIALLQGNEMHLFEGQVEGIILTERHGTGGFGYDSIFQPVEGDLRETAALLLRCRHRTRTASATVAALWQNLWNFSIERNKVFTTWEL